MSITLEEIAEAITDENGNTLYDDMIYLNEFLEDNDIASLEPESIIKEFLKDIVQYNRLTERNYQQIYDLIPDSASFSYRVASDKKVVQPVSYYKSNIQDPNTVTRTVLAIISDAIDENITYEVNESSSGSRPSDYEFFYEYDTIEPGFSIDTSTIRESDNIVGFFPKFFPDDRYLQFDFNYNDDNLYCVFSALFKQSDELYELCNLTKPETDFYTKNQDEKDFYLKIISQCGFNVEHSFAITTASVRKAYTQFAKTYGLNMNITYYYLKECHSFIDDGTTIDIGLIPHKTIKLNYGNTEPLRLTVAKLRNHMFNINIKNSRRCHAIAYLQEIANIYDTLKDRCVKNTLKEVSKMSREHAKEFMKKQQELIENPDELLKGIDIKSLATLEDKNVDTLLGEKLTCPCQKKADDAC